MSRRERRHWDLTDDQQAILLRDATDWLTARAADLLAASDDESWKLQVEEVAALGRLASGLSHGKMLRGDDEAKKLTALTVSETDHLDQVTEEYRRVLGEHEAWVALLAGFDAVAAGQSLATRRRRLRP